MMIESDNSISVLDDNKRVRLDELIADSGYYWLLVDSDALIDRGIYKNDMVSIKPARAPVDGQVVVAVVDQVDTTLRIYQRRGDMIELRSANKAFSLISVHKSRVRIEGVMQTLIRRYS